MKWILLQILFILAFASCKTNTVYVPVESVKTEYQDHFFRDSIYLKDSVFMLIKGDTVWVEKYKYLYRDKLIRDSIFVTDSIQVPYPVEVVKEVNHLKTWQVILMCFGVGVIAILGYRLYRLFD